MANVHSHPVHNALFSIPCKLFENNILVLIHHILCFPNLYQDGWNNEIQSCNISSMHSTCNKNLLLHHSLICIIIVIVDYIVVIFNCSPTHKHFLCIWHNVYPCSLINWLAICGHCFICCILYCFVTSIFNASTASFATSSNAFLPPFFGHGLTVDQFMCCLMQCGQVLVKILHILQKKFLTISNPCVQCSTLIVVLSMCNKQISKYPLKICHMLDSIPVDLFSYGPRIASNKSVSIISRINKLPVNL